MAPKCLRTSTKAVAYAGQPRTRTFTPLVALLPERSTLELSYLEATFSGLVSYGTSARLLTEVLPLGRRLHAQAVACGPESELGDEHHSFIEGCPRGLGGAAPP
ncbi:MAG: hypothetical protein ACP5VR_07640 [Acidimicrobiales bacterium]